MATTNKNFKVKNGLDVLGSITGTGTTGTLAALQNARHNVSGGGTITVDGSGNVLWSNRFIVISNGNGSHFSTSGYFDITCPTSGSITGVGGATNVTATAAGIPVGAWQAIYYILPIGSSSTSVAANFRIAQYTSALDIPSNWVLLCLCNADGGGTYYFPQGITLVAGESAVARQTSGNTANTTVKRNAAGAIAVGAVTAAAAGFSGDVNMNSNTQSRPATGSGVTINWNYTGGQAEAVFWNVYTPAAQSFSFKQMTSASTHTDLLNISAAGNATFAGTVIAPAATTSLAPLRIPHGTAPSAPTNGDVWTTTAGMYVRINGSTVGPLGAGGGATTSATAPVSPTVGQLWFDTDTGNVSVYYDSTWVEIGGSAAAVGGGTDQAFYENDTTITTNYTITAGRNAMSAGPITINSGVTVTVPTNSTWTVV